MASTAPQENIDIGRIFGRSFQVLGKFALPFIAASLILSAVPGYFLQSWMADSLDPTNPLALFTSPLYYGSLLVGIIGGALLQAILVRASVQHLSGKPVDIGETFATSLRYIVPLIVMSILIGIGVFIGLIFLIVPGVILYLMWAVAVPVMVEENAGIIDSMKRSAALTSGSKLMIFVLFLLIGILSFLLIAVLTLGAGFGGDMNLSTMELIGQAVAGAVSALISSAVVAALYVELRTVKEGASLEGLAAVFD